MLELERGPHPISDRDGRIYRVAVPVLKKTLRSFHAVVVHGGQRNVTVQKSVMHVQSCCFAN